MLRFTLILILACLLGLAYFARHLEAFFFLSLLVLIVILAIIRDQQLRVRQIFVNQLKSYQKDLRAGGTVIVDGMLIRKTSVLHTYYINIGALLGSITIPTRYHLDTGIDDARGLLCSLVSLVSGWWSLPYGPLINLVLVQQNFRGGEKSTVMELIDNQGSFHSLAQANPYLEKFYRWLLQKNASGRS